MTINNYLKKERFFLLSSILALFSLVSCQKQPAVTFGSTYVSDNNGANIVVVDTATVNMYTLYVDSTATAGTGFLEVGRLNDPYFGEISSRAYMQVTPPATATIDANDTYDSVGMILLFKKSNPFYGDSTLTQTIVVNQVDSLYQLAAFQSGFNSKSTLPLGPELGSTDIQIDPNIPYSSQGAGDTVRIRLDQEFGRQLYTMVYNRSDTILNTAKWLQWFHGLCFSPGPDNQGALFGFQDSAVLRIYYHKAGVYATLAFLDFTITNKGYQFNNVAVQQPNASYPLSRLTHAIKNPQIPPATRSDTLANGGYVQSIAGLTVKLTFPTLNSIALRQDYLSVLRAQLTVRPDYKTFSTSRPLPPQMAINATDLNNLPLGTSVSGSSGTQTGGLVVDFLNPLNMFYSYDVTNFVKGQISNSDPIAKQNGLLLSIPPPGGNTSFARVVLADGTYPVNQRVILSVYYISLFPHN